ncbi:MAG: thiolase family protein [FCB group bacterium]|jgi:acetyl-CoA acyltransferase|nr:thiolase family protein [FCB group bacterium]
MRDVYVVAAARTAIGRAIKGTLAQFRPEDMAAAAINAAVKRAGIPADKVQDVVMGCAMPEAEQGMNIARISVQRAGLPDQVSAMTINRFCSSGLEAMAIAAAKIDSGLFDIAVGGGVESMSLVPMGGNDYRPNPYLSIHRPEVYIGMGHCGDNVARDFKIARADMDQWALRSNQLATAAIDAGRFKDEIVPLEVPRNGGTVTFDTDEGPRRDTNIEALTKLKPAFSASPKNGFCTAGNSSQMSDGAAALVLMSGNAVKETGVKPLAKFLGYAVAADSPKYLGPAQLPAIKKACEMAGIKVEDLGLIECNEAFASQTLYVIRELGLDPEKVNVNGGAIALGHPLGCTGAKLSTQIIHEMKRRGEKYGLVTMCIGGGMGAAGVFELAN